MTEDQKNIIREMRYSGVGYKRIARELNLTRDEVRLFCIQNGMQGPGELVPLNLSAWYESIGHCCTCGKGLDQKHYGRKRHFCSGKCRTAYYRQLKKLEGEDFGGINAKSADML